MEINVLTPSEAFYWLGTTALVHGRRVSPRGHKTLEVQNVTCNIQHPHLIPVQVEGRELRPFIGAIEALQLVGQQAQPDMTTLGSKAMAAYTDDGIFAGSYGQRVYGQLGRAARALAEDTATRQAVVSIYDGGRDLLSGVKDVPCTLTLQFLWQERQGEVVLGLRASMRSNDVWLGLPYDLFQFISLQLAMCDALGVTPGTYTHTVGSLHAYEKDWDALSAIKNPGQPERHELDYAPRWGQPGEGFAVISSRARAILAGWPLNDATEFEIEHLMAPIGGVL
jgi:thymidylate synthase